LNGLKSLTYDKFLKKGPMKKESSSQQRFLNFLDPLHRLSDADQVFLLTHSEVVSAYKNAHLIHTGDEVTHVLYLLEGIVRYYITTEDGHEVTKAFYKDSFLLGSFDVTFNKGTNKFSVQALSDVRFLKIPLSNIRTLLETSHEFSKAYNRFLTSVFIFKEKREIELLSTTGKARFESFSREFPEIAEEISGVTLASYLGITPVQLSRIKNQLQTKKRI